MRYSHEYESLQRQLHERQDYGISGSKYTEYTLHLAENLKTRDILDYGAGKGTLQKGIPFPIQNYDPFVEEYAKRPHPATLVVCTDVLEHIELNCLEDVLADIASLTKGMLFAQIATRPAAKFLADGRNAHLIQENINWWVPHLMKHFDLQNLNNQKGSFISIWTARSETGNYDGHQT